MKQWLKNLWDLFTNIYSFFTMMLVLIILGYIFWYYSALELVIWNLWYIYAYSEIVIHILIAFLSSILFGALVYKKSCFSKISKREWLLWFIWTFFWILVAGCPVCTVTLASYLWLWWILLTLPYYWIEFKIVWLLLLIYGAYFSVRDINVCKLNNKSK